MPTVAVIGAGITGVTTAYELQNRGLDVVVFDRHRYAAMETSFATAARSPRPMANSGTRGAMCGRALRGC